MEDGVLFATFLEPSTKIEELRKVPWENSKEKSPQCYHVITSVTTVAGAPQYCNHIPYCLSFNITFLSPLWGSPSSIVAPGVTPESYFLL
jgi:hypothetical protein